MPALARAQKIFSKLHRKGLWEKSKSQLSEQELAEKVMAFIQEAESSGVDLESAVRRACIELERKYQ